MCSMVWYTYITPTIYIFQLIYRFVLALQQCSIRQDIRFNFGTNCPKPFPPKHGSGGISPVAAYRSEQPGAVRQGCISTAVYRRLALDWRPRLFYFPAAWRGMNPPEPHPFPWLGKGGGIGLNMNGGWLMNFTNSPYERMMKEIPHPETPAPQKAPEGTPCAGCPYWKGIGCLFCYREHLKKAGLMCGHLARKNALFARVSSLGFWGGNTIICHARILLNTLGFFTKA